MQISDLLGKTLKSVTGKVGGDNITFEVRRGGKYQLYHEPDCCESVLVEDICGELSDLVGSPILQAEENSSKDDLPGWTGRHRDDSFTWTFYRLATAKGSVVIRWYGSSNGYYSERVTFAKVS